MMLPEVAVRHDNIADALKTYYPQGLALMAIFVLTVALRLRPGEFRGRSLSR